MAVKLGLKFLVILRIICPILTQYAIPFESHDDCSVKTFEGNEYETYFNTVEMKCLPCAQDSTYQKTRGDGRVIF